MDIGTGSGILAIAAAKLSFRPILAFDFDPESVRVAGTNAKTNHVSNKIQLTQGDVTRLPLRPKIRYDLICANLISTLLVAERKRIIAQLNQGGTLVLAGILKTEFQEVQAAFESAGLRLVNSESLNEWQSGAFVRENKI
jgi:ribosomal protein L11 methyltransferase